MSSGSLPPPFAQRHALSKVKLGLSRPSSSGVGSSNSQGAGSHGAPQITHVPDQVTISLDKSEVENFLRRELNTPVLDELYPHLWLVGTMKGSHIDALHSHLLKGRRLFIAEDPGLHMLWFKDMAFFKPIPPALLNHDFWSAYLSEPPPPVPNPLEKMAYQAPFDRMVALGFLRSYAYLIQHRSDLDIAVEHRLVPADVTWERWDQFINPFRQLKDIDVAKRYHFGQLRISRLNHAVRIFRPASQKNKRHYREMYHDTTSFLERFIAPLFFIFATVSLMLSAMQLAATLPQSENGATKNVFWGFGIFSMITVAICWGFYFGGPALYLTAQMIFGYKTRRKFKMEISAGRMKV